MKNTIQAAHELFKTLIVFCNKPENRGAIKELTARLSHRLGRKVHRQLTESWLHIDRSKRVEPKLGAGLVIYEEGEIMMSGKVRKIDVKLNNRNASRNQKPYVKA